MRYDRRDRIGHWVRKQQPARQHCQHACCRGYREHPEHYPVILPKSSLRRAREEDLAAHFAKVSAIDSPEARRSSAQILHEMERRDTEAERKRQRKEAVAGNRIARQLERESEVERVYLEAEAYTRGNWVNARGARLGVSDREILTGRAQVFDRYASEEAREFFRGQGRPTAAYFQGKDTRYSGAYTLRSRRPRRDRLNGRVWAA
jgi:hypothetical protein